MNPCPMYPAVGLHPGIAPEIYFADQSDIPLKDRFVSKSLLSQFYKNPKRWLEAPPFKVTEAMKWGSLVDCLALTPDRYPLSYKVQPDVYLSKESAKKDAAMIEKPWNWNSTTCKQWRANLPAGVECISTYDFHQACKARDALFARREFREMMNGGQTQVGMRVDLGEDIHGIDGLVIPAKGLLDIVPAKDGKWGNALCDLKMFAKLNTMEDVEKEIYNRLYMGQAAFYVDMYNALTGENRFEFFFVFQLSEAPYEVAIVELSEDAIIAGRRWYLSAVKEWAKAVTTGNFPSPWDGIQMANLPKWAAKKEGLA